MDIAVLFSGGKDSAYALWLAQKEGHRVKYLVSIIPEAKDSWLYHSANIGLTSLQAQALKMSLIQNYASASKEVEALLAALKNLAISGVISGAIASTFQKKRIDSVCKGLDLTHIAPLWGRDQKALLYEITEAGFDVIITSASAEGFTEKWLGRKIDFRCIEDLIKLHEKYEVNLSGEGGEYETLVLNAPNFKNRLIIDKYKIIWHRDHGLMNVLQARLAVD